MIKTALIRGQNDDNDEALADDDHGCACNADDSADDGGRDDHGDAGNWKI